MNNRKVKNKRGKITRSEFVQEIVEQEDRVKKMGRSEVIIPKGTITRVIHRTKPII